MKYLGTHHAVGSFRYSISPNIRPPNNFLFLCIYNQGAKFLGIYLGQINPLTWDSWNSEGLSQTWFFQFSPKNIGTKIEYVPTTSSSVTGSPKYLGKFITYFYFPTSLWAKLKKEVWAIYYRLNYSQSVLSLGQK